MTQPARNNSLAFLLYGGAIILVLGGAIWFVGNKQTVEGNPGTEAFGGVLAIIGVILLIIGLAIRAAKPFP
jgi:uncharacterized membrane protein YidH (DUF202 family)